MIGEPSTKKKTANRRVVAYFTYSRTIDSELGYFILKTFSPTTELSIALIQIQKIALKQQMRF